MAATQCCLKNRLPNANSDMPSVELESFTETVPKGTGNANEGAPLIGSISVRDQTTPADGSTNQLSGNWKL